MFLFISHHEATPQTMPSSLKVVLCTYRILSDKNTEAFLYQISPQKTRSVLKKNGFWALFWNIKIRSIAELLLTDIFWVHLERESIG